jgi:cytochrome P450
MCARPIPVPVSLQDPTVDSRGFLPFSIGSRNCVGQALALVELKAVLALLLGTFRFNLHPSMGGFEGVDASAKQTVTLRPEHGLLMTLQPRADSTA